MSSLSRVLFIILFSLFGNCIYATHIVGGEMIYTCVGNDSVEIQLKLYRDCRGGGPPFDNPASIFLFDSAGSILQILNIQPEIFNVPLNSVGPCFTIPPNLCLQEAIYSTTVVLQVPPGGITLTYQRCCRNTTITNLQDPGTQGATFTAYIPDTIMATCNSSPVFDVFPPVVICQNDTLRFDHSATDPDGDSLVYELCDALIGASQIDPQPNPQQPPPYSSVTYSAGFNSTNPMAATPSLSINPKTGLLTGYPNTPGQYVVSICVKEFRQGKLIDVHRREFQFNVTACSPSLQADFVFSQPICLGEPIQFTDQSNDANGQVVTWNWFFGDGDTSDIQNPIHQYDTQGVYDVLLITSSDSGCVDSVGIKLVIDPYPEFQVSSDGSICHGDSLQLMAEGGTSYQWTPSFGLSSTDISGPLSSPDSTTVYTVIISDDCFSDTLQTRVTVHPNPKIDLLPTDTVVFKDEMVQLKSHATSYESLEWSYFQEHLPNHDNQQTIGVIIRDSALYFARVVDHNGCRSVDSAVIHVLHIGVPNAFTPNKDGLNDLLGVKSNLSLENVVFSVYNRWGELVFRSDSPAIVSGAEDVTPLGWDGTYKGKEQPVGVYTYWLRFLLYGQSIQKTGNVTLLR